MKLILRNTLAIIFFTLAGSAQVHANTICVVTCTVSKYIRFAEPDLLNIIKNVEVKIGGGETEKNALKAAKDKCPYLQDHEKDLTLSAGKFDCIQI